MRPLPHHRTWLGMIVVGLAPLMAADPAPAKPLLSPLFSDAAVLQRDKPVAVWGWAAPGAEVTVAVAGGAAASASKTAKAGADGRWQVAIGPFAAGGPYVLTVTSGTAKAEAKDVLVGDVWLCSGQSNMEMAVAGCMNFNDEKAQANFPQIRHIRVERANVAEPVDQFKGAWRVTTPETVGGFTAAGYFMARKLHQDLHVPIGLVHSSWGGTPAEAWTSQEALATLPDQAKAVADFQALAKKVAEQKASTGKDYPELIKAWYQANDPGTSATPAWSSPEADVSTWSTVTLPALFEDAGTVAKTYDGTVWVRREFTLPESAAGKAALLTMGRIDDFDTTWVNGQQVGGAEIAWTDRKYNVPAKLLKAGTNVVVSRIVDVSGKGGITTKPESMGITPQGGELVPLAGEWKAKVGVELAKAPPLPVRTDRTQGPGALYNGMISPLLPMAFTGTIWYQGEANAGRAKQYRSLLTTMIGDWRSRFGQPDTAFLIVSLANYMERRDQPGESSWAELREAQAQTATGVAKGGLALAIDIGEAKDIHPKNKQEVGRRLALAAEAVAYGKPVEWSGPWYREMKVDGAAVRLSFDHLGGGLASVDNAALVGFSVAGEDKKFVWADAKIDGDSVVVSAASVAKPVAVRYAWADNPAGNLLNKAGLPAVPFRTDVPVQPAPAK